MRRIIMAVAVAFLVALAPTTALANRFVVETTRWPKVNRDRERVTWDARLEFTNNTRYNLRVRCTAKLGTRKYWWNNTWEDVQSRLIWDEKTLRFRVGPNATVKSPEFHLVREFDREMTAETNDGG